MTRTQPLTAARLAGFIWLLLAPLVWLGAAVSKMESDESYNIQLGLATVLGIVAIGAAYGAFRNHRWARSVLLALNWSSAAFWIYAGIANSSKMDFDLLPVGIGGCFIVLAALLHLDVDSRVGQT